MDPFQIKFQDFSSNSACTEGVLAECNKISMNVCRSSLTHFDQKEKYLLTLALVSSRRKGWSRAQTIASIFTIEIHNCLVKMAPQTSRPPSLPADCLQARSLQPGVLSQGSSARNPQPGILEGSHKDSFEGSLPLRVPLSVHLWVPLRVPLRGPSRVPLRGPSIFGRAKRLEKILFGVSRWSHCRFSATLVPRHETLVPQPENLLPLQYHSPTAGCGCGWGCARHPRNQNTAPTSIRL